MENDIIARTERLGHEVEGLHFFSYDVRVSNPTITEKVMGKFKQVTRYTLDDETTYLVFEEDTSKLKPAYGLSFVKKLLSGEVIETQTHCICRDKAKLVARIEAEQEEELRRQIQEKKRQKMSSVDWEERTWQLFSKLVVINKAPSDYLSDDVKTLIKIAHDAVEEYKKSLEEEE